MFSTDPMPFDKWTRKHIDSHPENPYKEGGAVLSMLYYTKDGFPQLQPWKRMYGTFLYDPDDVLKWFQSDPGMASR